MSRVQDILEDPQPSTDPSLMGNWHGKQHFGEKVFVKKILRKKILPPQKIITEAFHDAFELHFRKKIFAEHFDLTWSKL